VLTPRGPTVPALRYAAQRAVARSSLRKVAGEMGMAVSWLNGFVLGKETELRAKTMKNLREWYVRVAPDLVEQDEGTAVNALEFLVSGILDEAERTSAYSRLLRLLARAYSDQGPLPDWIRALLERDESGER
jgi:hypothetical protein